jgi:hypothetical protein
MQTCLATTQGQHREHAIDARRNGQTGHERHDAFLERRPSLHWSRPRRRWGAIGNPSQEPSGLIRRCCLGRSLLNFLVQFLGQFRVHRPIAPEPGYFFDSAVGFVSIDTADSGTEKYSGVTPITRNTERHESDTDYQTGRPDFG